MRRFYDETDIPYDTELSHKNEPETNLSVRVQTRMYPNMLECYQRVSQLFNVSIDEIIIGNGFENVMKNVLLALKPETMSWYKPSWGMLDVYCEALDIKPQCHKFKYENGLIKTPEIPIKTDVFYTTYNANNLFTHTNPNPLYIESNYNIIDVSYLTLEEIQHYLEEERRIFDIIIGSFDKLYGCGIRLGFAIFPESLSPQIHLQREQYINLVAEQVLCGDLQQPFTKWFDEVSKLSLPKGTMITHNYITIPFEYNGLLPHKTFKVGNQTFSRFGMPHNYNTFMDLKKIL